MTERQLPGYRRIANEVRAAIAAGEFAEGDRLPSVSALAERFAVTTGVVVRALEVLKAEGLVIARHGSGVFVRRFAAIRRSSPARLSRARWGTGQMIQDADTEVRPRVVDVVVAESPAPAWVAEPLGLTSGSDVLSRSRRFLVEDRPVQLAVSYYPADLVRGTRIALTDTGPGGAYARLAEQGHAPAHFTEYVRGRFPSPVEAGGLELQAGTFVLEITRHAFTAAGLCVEVNRMILDATAYILDYTFDA
ncbi:GntR family transcriptional regulator [Longispora fulva]|uniref:GntR family transcriptional regulator n=1 Tax=Longispora fulva TaxID=619741 RepID=A0A8J7KLQ8_9ACTN|nr:GntR family transcriptional regulator [Longispora fulva]MBG6139654.1 GntR family transcriptional regulator [Longispora fulva]GIG57964.1 GntR family transcriptional regulator [Longispora fulva]